MSAETREPRIAHVDRRKVDLGTPALSSPTSLPLVYAILAASWGVGDVRAAQSPEEVFAPPSPPTPPFRLALTVENDAFSGSDDNYTNGVGITLQTAESRQYSPGTWQRSWMDLWSFLPHIGEDSCLTHAAWTIGQELFTPEDITLSDPPDDDQPYTGMLFLDSSLYARNQRVTHAWNLRLGYVGPGALGKETQTEYHSLIGAQEPKGWATQLPDEPVLNLDYTVGYRLVGQALWKDAELRLVPLASASLGNYFTGFGAGLYAELGWRAPPGVGLLSIRRGLDPFMVSASDGSAWSLSLYAGGGWFGVAHYLPLDGTVLRDSPSVDSEPSIAFVSTGLVVRSETLSIGYLLTRFGDTFEGQTSETDYGTLTLSWSL